MAENGDALLNAFRERYPVLERKVSETVRHSLGDTTVIERVGDEVDEFARIVRDNIQVFPEAEAVNIETNLMVLQSEIRRAYESSVDTSHNGCPVVIQRLQTGKRGRPPVIIDSSFLRIAYSHRGASWIARYLGCSRTTVRKALLDYGIAAPCPNPIPLPPGPSEPNQQHPEGAITNDAPPLIPIQRQSASPPPLHSPGDLPSHDDLDGILQSDQSIPTIHSRELNTNPLHSFTGPVSIWSDEELDTAIRRLRLHYPRSGLSMLDGMLRTLGHNVPRERLRQSLFRIDPVERVFGRIQIQRRTYSVPGPNSLWHHDGQHGLIRWGIVIHGFIDGYSRLVTGLRASNNNRGDTVLDLFLGAARNYGIPSRIRGDHGVENIKVAAFMELHKGLRRGSYIWGRSIHNIRIERLWVDVTAQFGHKWHEFFTDLEIHHGLDIHNPNHKWLLQYLFLTDINNDATFFAEAWNQHKLKVKGRASRTPAEMFFFDMLVHGTRGDHLSEEELVEFGVDWEGMDEEELIQSNMNGNPLNEGVSSWVGRTGPPPHLNEVSVDVPDLPLDHNQLERLYTHISPFLNLFDPPSMVSRWTMGLSFSRLCNNEF